MIEVLREGEPTIDGRFINRGAIELPDAPVPLFDYDRDKDNASFAKVGELFNFMRDSDDRIYCESTLEDDDRTVTLTVAIDEHQIVGDESIGVSKGRILGGVIGDGMTYPWK